MKLRPASATLNELNEGKTMGELALGIHEAIEAVTRLGKSGTVTLTLTVATMKQMHSLVNPPIIVTGEVTSKLPQPPLPATVFFVDEDGNPTRNQTREPELPGLTSVDKSTGEIKYG